MRDEDVLIGSLIEDSWMTLEQVAAACRVEPGWLMRHIEEGFLPHAECVAGVWRVSSASVQRARRIRQMERDFDAGPELAALVADMLDELDDLRRRLRDVKP
ncbi:MAG: chaperone modulator CbpM [Ignavibacteria bacterium]